MLECTITAPCYPVQPLKTRGSTVKWLILRLLKNKCVDLKNRVGTLKIMYINNLYLSVYTLIYNYKLLHEGKKHDIYTIYTHHNISLYTFENVQKGIQG